MDNHSDEIDLIELLKTVWDGRKQVIIIRTQMVLIFGFIGLITSSLYVLIKKPAQSIIKEIIS